MYGILFQRIVSIFSLWLELKERFTRLIFGAFYYVIIPVFISGLFIGLFWVILSGSHTGLLQHLFDFIAGLVSCAIKQNKILR